MGAMGGLIDLISRGGSYAAGLDNDRVKAATDLAKSQVAVQEEERLKMQREAEAAKRAQEDQNILTMAMREPGMNRKRMADYLLQKMSPSGFHNWRKQDMEMEKSVAALDEAERKRQTDLHTKAGQILSAVAASKDPMAAYVQAHPQLQGLGSDFQFPAAEQFDQEQLPFMIGALGYADDFLKQRQGEAGIQKTQQDIKTAAQKLMADQQEAFVSKLTPDMTDAEYQALRKNSPPHVADRFPAKAGEWIPRTLKTAIAVKDRAKAEQEALVLAGMNPQGITALESAKLKSDSQKTEFDQNLANKKFAEDKRHHMASEDSASSLTPDAKLKMAEMFATTGAMPPLGMGKAATTLRSEIINLAAKQFPNVDFASQKASYQANESSLKSYQKQKDSIEAFEATAGKNLDQFLRTAKGVVDSGSPLINRPLRAISESGLGGAEQTAFNVARQVAVTEIAKVLSNPGGNSPLSDSARHEVQQLIGPDATLKQIYAAAKILKSDMASRRQAMDEQIDAIRGRIATPGGEQGKSKAPHDPMGVR